MQQSVESKENLMMLHLLLFKKVLVEDMLQILIDVIDAHLLQAVALEDFKAGNVKEADEAVGSSRVCNLG